jgi:hypothetical protein
VIGLTNLLLSIRDTSSSEHLDTKFLIAIECILEQDSPASDNESVGSYGPNDACQSAFLSGVVMLL